MTHENFDDEHPVTRRAHIMAHARHPRKEGEDDFTYPGGALRLAQVGAYIEGYLDANSLTPGRLTWKYDGGRGAMLSEDQRIVGYWNPPSNRAVEALALREAADDIEAEHPEAAAVLRARVGRLQVGGGVE